MIFTPGSFKSNKGSYKIRFSGAKGSPGFYKPGNKPVFERSDPKNTDNEKNIFSLCQAYFCNGWPNKNMLLQPGWHPIKSPRIN